MTATVAKPARDLRFDSLRGLMLIVMTVNHLPSVLRFLTDKSLGIFTAAEGFVFLSGIMAGWVYTRRRRREGSAGLWKATRGRATMIYRWHLVSFFGAFAAVRLTDWLFGFCSQNSPLLFYQHPFQAVVLGLTLLYQPGMLDILPLYAAVVVALPWVLDQLEAGRRWRVIIPSVLCWLIAQVGAPVDGGTYFPIVLGSFNPFAWQLLFFAGVMIGHRRADPERDLLPFRPLVTLAALALAVFGWGVVHYGWRTPGSDELFGSFLNKPSLGLVRLLNFLGFAYLVGMVGKHFPRLLTWKPVAFLGQHSIVVFSIQSIFGITFCQFDGLFSTPTRSALTTALAVGLLWVSAALHQAYQSRSRARGEGPQPGPEKLRARQDSVAALGPRHDLHAA